MKVIKTILVWAYVITMGIGVNAKAAEKMAMPMGKMQSLLELNSKEKDWKIMYGLKVWANEWSLPLEFAANDKTYIMEYESDLAITPIPAVLAKYRNFFISGSYLMDTDYEFPSQQTKWWETNEYDETIIYLEDADVSGSRKEWDVNIGCFLTPNLAVSLGYKSLERELTLTGTDFWDYYSYKTNYPLSVHAPIIGISASMPVNDKFNFYGNLAYGWLNGDASYELPDEKKNDLDVDGNYALGELGFGYTIPLKRKFASTVTINAGYRFQRLDMKFRNKEGDRHWGESGDQHDSTAGFILGVGASY